MATQFDSAAPLDEYEALRRRVQQQADLARQKSQEGLARKFASQGMSNSGAQLKLQQQTDSDINRDVATQNDTIGFQEAQERQRRKEVGEARTFQTSEREGAQNFANQQRLGGQDFTAAQNDANRSQAKQFFDADLAFKNSQLNQQESQFGRQLAQTYTEMEASQKNNKLSAILARAQIEDFGDLPGDVQDQINTSIYEIPTDFANKQNAIMKGDAPQWAAPKGKAPLSTNDFRSQIMKVFGL